MLGKFFGKSHPPSGPTRKRSPGRRPEHPGRRGGDSPVVRVFISSTFVDMQVERDILVRHTFPALRARLRARGVEVLEIDLRWGVKQEDAENGKTLPICLTEVSRCKPYFIGLLGDRYGTLLTSDMLSPQIVDEFPVLRDGIGRSMTEIEITHGVLRDAKTAGSAFFFVRDPKGAPENIPLEGADAKIKLERLKASIRTSGATIVPYARPEDIGTTVESIFGAALEAIFPEVSPPDHFTNTLHLHTAFARERRGVQIGAAPYFARLDQWIKQSALSPLLITGDSGGGKSTLLANWLHARHASNPSDIIIEHYLAASPDSADPSLLLRRIWEHLNRSSGDVVELPSGDADLMDLSSGLIQRLIQASLFAARNSIEIIIALDGLDKLSSDQDLRWLPCVLPPHVKLLGSALESEARHAASARDWALLEIKPLDETERRAFVIGTLERMGKSLSPERITRVVAHPLGGTPLFLRTLLDELRFSATNERLDERLNFYLEARDIAGLFARQLDRLERDCGFALVASATSHIWASHAGLEETEIRAITGALPLAWATLRNALGDSLREQQGRVTFSHDFLRNAVETRYLATNDKKRIAHLSIADHFDRQPFETREAEELPFQLRAAEEWERLEVLLTDLDRFRTMAERGDAELLKYWLALRHRSPEKALVEALLSRTTRPSTWSEADVRLAFAIGKFLRFAGANGESIQALFLHIAEATQRLFGPKHHLTLASMSNLASILAARGDLDGAIRQQERVWSASEQALGKDHPDSLTSMNNFAASLKARGDLAKAQELYARVLKGRTRVLGGEHPDTLVCMNNLAMTMAARGDLVGAKNLQERALGACTRLLGGDHPETLTCLNNLASLHAMSGNLSGARQLEERVLETRVRLLGEKHPDTLISLNNLAATLYARGNLEEAQKHQQLVLDARMEVLGPDHPLTLTSLNNLAQTIYSRGNLETAQLLQDQALEASTRVLGAEHPDTLMSMNNLAVTLSACGNFDRAKNLQERALEASTRLLGADHHDTLTYMSNLGEILDKGGDLAGAQRLAEQATASMIRVLGPDHPSTLTSTYNLGVCLFYRHDLDGALKHFTRVAEARRRLFGSTNPETKIAEEGIAMVRAAIKHPAPDQRRRTPPPPAPSLSSLNPLTFGGKARCCWNALMAAYTYSFLDEEARRAVREKTLEIHKAVTGIAARLDDLPLTTLGLYHFYSLAMQNLDIAPRIGRDLWFKVVNPFNEQVGAEELYTTTKRELENQHGVSFPDLLGEDPFPPTR